MAIASTPQGKEVSPSAVAGAALVASGAGARVYRGTLGGARVALRRPRIRSSEALARFEGEVALRARLRHPNVLPLLAACTAPPDYCTVSPWMPGGAVFDVLHAHALRFSFQRILELAVALASGMRYLHKLNLVHRDLKTANLLLNDDWTQLVIADLDLAVDVDKLREASEQNGGRAVHRGPSNGRLSHMVGTLVYMAPECLSGKPHTFAADVYAFAIAVNEMATCAVPFVDRKLPVPELHTVLETRFNEVTLRSAIVKNNLRPVLATSVPEQFSALLEQAWHPEPAARPTFSHILEVLEAMLARGPEYLAQYSAGTVDEDIEGATMDADDDDDASKLFAEIRACSAAPMTPAWQVPRRMDATYTPDVCGGLSSTCGARGADRMEDRSLILEQLADMPNMHMFSVFDGHGGQACSEFAAKNLPGALFRAWMNEDATPESALVHAFEDTDRAFLRTSPISEESGCTALSALIVDSTLYVANAGDCRCVLVKSNGKAVTLTKDHVATDPGERARVLARGGHVTANGRVEGRIMVSRAMGDRPVKRFVAPTPEVTTVQLAAEDEFLILASDGLWDVVSSEQAADLVRATVRVPELAAKRLALKAIELESGDNISVIVVFLVKTSSFDVVQKV